MLTYYNDSNIKAVRMERCKAHMEADRLFAGTYGEENGSFRACAIGCQVYDIAQERGVDWRTLTHKHEVVAEDYGWPIWLCHLEDTIFEGLPRDQQKSWPLRLVSAVPVGQDVSIVRHQFLAFIAREIVTFDREKYPDVAAINERVATLHDRAASGDMPGKDDWAAAGFAARSARSVNLAVDSAVSSAVRSAINSVNSLNTAVRLAVRLAVNSLARSAESTAAYTQIADKLIALLQER